MAIEQYTGIQRWLACQSSLSADGGDEMAYELRNNGLNELYGCQNPQVVSSKRFRTDTIMDQGQVVEIAILRSQMISAELSAESADNLRSRSNTALASTCLECPYFQPKASPSKN